jgi:hypothetical protein
MCLAFTFELIINLVIGMLGDEIELNATAVLCDYYGTP